MRNRGRGHLDKTLSISVIVWGIMALIIAMFLGSCSSDPAVHNCDNKEWNIDPELESDFWGAVNLLEKRGTNLKKLQSEDVDVVFVDKLEGGSELTVAMAKKIYGDGILIHVLKSKWVKAETRKQQLENQLIMLHELGHDYLNLKGHYENGWDVMNSTTDPNIDIDENKLHRSIDRMLYQGRRVYDSLALTKRF